MPRSRRSGCPISFSLDLFGDRWTLLVLRDLVFQGPRYYGDFLDAGEGIATNVLADRLDRLEGAGLVHKRKDPRDKKRYRYSLTPKGADTIPILLELIRWGATHDSETAAPDVYVERIVTDRNGIIAELRARADPGEDAL